MAASKQDLVAGILSDLCWFLPEAGLERKILGASRQICEDPKTRDLTVKEVRSAVVWWIGQIEDTSRVQDPPGPHAIRRSHVAVTERDRPIGRPDNEGSNAPPPVGRKALPMYVRLKASFAHFCSTAPDRNRRSWTQQAQDDWAAMRDGWESVLPSSSRHAQHLVDQGVDLAEWVERMNKGLPHIDPEEDPFG